ncbi:hypothetical protein ACFV84_17830 [Kitasatospora sp. NPDC059811]|nr:hypothetical protein [Streptomyces sp. MJM8645]
MGNLDRLPIQLDDVEAARVVYVEAYGAAPRDGTAESCERAER